jgi:DNA polymerase III subunit alpha
MRICGIPCFPFRAEAFVFVHLHCHSHYSFLRGVASPEEIIAAAVEQKMPAVALTDTNGLYAAVPFYQAAKKMGVKAIVGVTLDVEESQDSRAKAARRKRSFSLCSEGRK